MIHAHNTCFGWGLTHTNQTFPDATAATCRVGEREEEIGQEGAAYANGPCTRTSTRELWQTNANLNDTDPTHHKLFALNPTRGEECVGLSEGMVQRCK